MQLPELILGTVVIAEAIVLALLWILRSRERAELAEAREYAASLEREVEGNVGAPASTGPAERAVRGVLRTARLVRDQGISGLFQSTVDELTAWATDERGDILDLAAPDGTVTLFFSDIERSTELNDRMGDAMWVRALDAHDRVLRGRIAQYRGQVVKTVGDGYMVAFPDPAAACRAAFRIQQDLSRSMDPALWRHGSIRVRIGIHCGHVVARDGDYFGRNVAMAARIADLASGGHILVSDTVSEALAERDDIQRVVEYLGETELRGLAGLHRIWRLVGKPSAASS